MADILTPQQQEAVYNRGGRLLVSAAAGSGKTKVLVERLMSYLLDPHAPANLDDFLIITYTKAAAAELRGKIAARLSDKIAENPENLHLQRQMQRLYLANISTVHSFCGDILREYAYLLDIPADFRVADENECRDVQYKLIDRILEQAYEDAAHDLDFQAFINTQGFGRDDRQIPAILLSVYQSARCHLHPDKWIQWCLDSVETDSYSDAAETVWGRYLIDDLDFFLKMQIQALETCIEAAVRCGGMDKPVLLLRDTVIQLEQLCAAQKWDDIYRRKNIQFGTLRFAKNVPDTELVERIKAVRKACKLGLEKKLRSFASESRQVLRDLQDSASAVRGLITLVRHFSEQYDRAKRARHILDFGDLEHKTLDLLVGMSRTGPTALARQIAERYREVMVDEYQDSNSVQDAIFSVLTEQRQNGFMVGDVKQSIYQFRLADPSIFLEKYNTYLPAKDARDGVGRKVLLSSNFRSSGGIIEAVNHVFTTSMSPEVGGIVYDDAELLREGIPHVSISEPETELYAIDVQADTYAEEAAFTAERIASLLDGKHLIRDRDKLRTITPGDIVILLRSPSSVKSEFIFALEQCGIPYNSGDSVGLLETEEVTVLRSLLEIVSNPQQDIPLISVLVSRIFQFTASDLASIRGRNRKNSFYERLCKQQTPKCSQFVTLLDKIREESRLYSLTDLLQRIFLLTSMDSLYGALPDGTERKNNLTLFCQLAAQYESIGNRDLSQFLDYLRVLEENGFSTVAQESNHDAVTIMSIHKSKGLEFPVVFLCGLSRGFNQESTRAQVLCHKELGLGLCCVDPKNRVRYSSIAKKAIALKMQEESISEEMRVLYVAMTRPRDRLIMTYAAQNITSDLSDIALRCDMTPKLLMTQYADCPGFWVLMAAMHRVEAGALFAVAGRPDHVCVMDYMWNIQLVQQKVQSVVHTTIAEKPELPEPLIQKLRDSLQFRYGHAAAVSAPSKLTATQMKGRLKDQEAAENTDQPIVDALYFRKPSFVNTAPSSTERGSIIHTVMQYIRYERCLTVDGVRCEIQRMEDEEIISASQTDCVDPEKIAALFRTELGKKMCNSDSVIREFKFSILDDCALYDDVEGEEVLIQGVIDCALIEEDGIIVIDFKTDAAKEEKVDEITARYRPQVCAYSRALEKIYRLRVKSCYLYLFALDRFIEVDI